MLVTSLSACDAVCTAWLGKINAALPSMISHIPRHVHTPVWLHCGAVTHIVHEVAQAVAHRARQDVHVDVPAVRAVLLHAADDALRIAT